MTRPAPTPPASDAGAETQLAESAFDASAFEQSLARREPNHWIGWRLRLLVLAALAGCGAVFAVMHLLAGSAQIDASWQATARGQLTLLASPHDELRALAGRTLDSVGPAQGPVGSALPLDELALQRTARWLVDDRQRVRYLELQDRLAGLLAGGRVQLRFTDGSSIEMDTQALGYAGLGFAFSPLAAFALVLFLVATAVLLLRPGGRNLSYAAMAWCQALNVLLVAAEHSHGLGQPAGFASLDLFTRYALDVATAALALASFARHPRPVPQARAITLSAFGVAVVWAAAAAAGWFTQLWWATQAVLIGLGCTAVAVVAWSYRLVADPFVAVVRRISFIALALLMLVTVVIAATHRIGGTAAAVAAVGAVIWVLFIASLLLLVPFLAGSRRVVREFALLAGIGTVAASFTLLLAAVFSLAPVAALAIAVALALVVYVVARRWILAQMVGANLLTPERVFEQLYRTARDVQDHPERFTALLERLMQELFEPQEVLAVPRRLPASRVVSAGSALYVPLPSEAASNDRNQVLIMRHASRGKRIFTHDDALLADRVVEQLGRAVAYDQAVERGRAEERSRIAQDLHDDIGARLLTLMYKAGDREIEDYIRHTLQDLKTLTRGLAATQHHLAHAAGEWKGDLSQRLEAAKLRFGWSFSADADVPLNVVQWSALTRILRELVSNAIAHAEASRVDVRLTLAAGQLTLVVTDDGKGGDPSTWSHGLGLGGVRKRVRALNGSVAWSANEGGGICCEVRLPGIGVAAAPPGSTMESLP